MSWQRKYKKYDTNKILKQKLFVNKFLAFWSIILGSNLCYTSWIVYIVVCDVFVYPFSCSSECPKAHTTTTSKHRQQKCETSKKIVFWMNENMKNIFVRKNGLAFFFWPVCPTSTPYCWLISFSFIHFLLFKRTGMWTLEIYRKVLNNTRWGWMGVHCTHDI